MATLLTRKPSREASPGERPIIRRRGDVLHVLLSLWMMVGIFVDGWAHQNLPETLETFFTPWHALFYSGAAATAFWILWVGRDALKRGAREATPAGYGLGVVGVLVFIAGAATDTVWHLAWGIELQLDALLSPPHLVIVTGVMLMITCSFRSAWATPGESVGLRAFWPALLSISLAVALASFMFMYLSPFLGADMDANVANFVRDNFARPDHFEFVQYLAWRSGIGAVLVQNALLLGAAMLVLRRWRVPFGTFTILFGSTALMMTGLYGFRGFPLALAGIGGGMAADWLNEWLRPNPERPGAFRAFGAAASASVWGLYVVAVAIAGGLGWPPELWGGILVWSALEGFAIAYLITASPPPRGQ